MSVLDGKKPHKIVPAAATIVSGVDTPVGTMIRRLVPYNSVSMTFKGEVSDSLVAQGCTQYVTLNGLVGGASVTMFGSFEKEFKSVTADTVLLAEYW